MKPTLLKALCALSTLTPLASPADVQWLADAQGCKLENPRPLPLQSVTWSGACRDGFAEGTGRKQTRVDGVTISTYDGEMKTGRLAGQGVLTMPYGQRYDGSFVDGRYEGAGLLTFPRGTVYRGEFVAGRAEGACSIAWPDGHHYQGQCKAARPQGQGEVQFGNGDRYVGAFNLGQPSGQGRYTWAVGNVYEGSFEDGDLHGQGDYRFADGSRYTGQLMHGLPSGQGQIQQPGGPSYEGPFAVGSPTMSGNFLNADGSPAPASMALRVKLTPRYVLPQKLASANRYTAPADICRKKLPPEVPKAAWAGRLHYRAFVIVRDGAVTRVDVAATGPVNEALHPQFIANIERAIRAYDCPGDHVIEQPFAFEYSYD
ncbi:MORN repeat-containing protein [Roseateles sp. LYH14W]|uniref:MORN repeat-containing protein n=1 Tax=Pelomonas parva TaxID=3299032 RepID=A0ABW7F7R3_9BURK